MEIDFRPNLSTLILDWYARNQRSLPWRETSDPYPIWVAEVMLQQTRVDTVLPYYKHWLQVFPTMQSLAEASQEQVLAIWEGLGYYSRARNMHKTAQIVVAQHQGKLPDNLVDLKRLPGIGTAGAADILSIAYGQDYASVDGNIRRVISRIFEMAQIPGTPDFESTVQQIVNRHLPAGKAGDYNQAWMDLGATICLPSEPKCDLCPLQSECDAAKHQTQGMYPLKREKTPIPIIVSAVAVFILPSIHGIKTLVYQRPQQGLLAGLWAFPNIKQSEGSDLTVQLRQWIFDEFQITPRNIEPMDELDHVYTHFKSKVLVYHIETDSDQWDRWTEQQYHKVNVDELETLPMGKLDRLIAKKVHLLYKQQH